MFVAMSIRLVENGKQMMTCPERMWWFCYRLIVIQIVISFYDEWENHFDPMIPQINYTPS